MPQKLRLSLLVVALFLGSVILFLTCANPFSSEPVNPNPELFAWVQVAPSYQVGATRSQCAKESSAGTFLARAITTEAACPTIHIDATSKLMTLRVAPSQDFPVRVCEASIPSGASGASVKSGSMMRTLPTPNVGAQKIAVIGDAGCRIEVKGDKIEVQDCNRRTPTGWPFNTVLANVVAAKPDVIFHVGDYVYRSSPCPADKSKDCPGSPYGDNWPAWRADFFADAQTLFDKAPWIFARGNHEICSRNGEGWFRFFDPRPYNAGSTSCQDLTSPYLVDYASVHLAVIDAASAPDTSVSEDINGPRWLSEYLQQMSQLGDTLACLGWSDAWLLLHQPFWGIKPQTPSAQHSAAFDILTPTLNTALLGTFPEGLKVPFNLAISGHIHFTQALDMGPNLPAQIIVGNSGTKLVDDFSTSFSLAQAQAVSPQIKQVWSSPQTFGHTLITPLLGQAGSNIVFYDLNNQAIPGRTFTLVKNRLKPNP